MSIQVGPRAPTADSVSLPGNINWNDEANAYASDNAYAKTGLNVGQSSLRLHLFGFGFTIPTGATIRGIKIEAEARVIGLVSGINMTLRVRKTAAVFGSSTTVSLTGSDAWYSLGGATNLLGLSWTPAEINASSCGLYLSMANVGGAFQNDISVDAARITVWYDPPPHEVVIGSGIGSGVVVGTPTVLPYRNLSTEISAPAAMSAEMAVLTEWGPDAISMEVKGTSFVGFELYVPEYVELETTIASTSLLSFDPITSPVLDAAIAAQLALGVVLDVDTAVELDVAIASAVSMSADLDVPPLPIFPIVRVKGAFQGTLRDQELVFSDFTPRVRSVSIRRGKPNELADVDPGAADIEVDNRRREFDPSNISSPYYPYLLPRRPLEIEAEYLGVAYPLIATYSSRWPQRWQRKKARVEIDSFDGLALLAGKDVSGDYPKELTGQRITRILDLARWWPERRRIDPGQSYVRARVTEENAQPLVEKALDHMNVVALKTEQGALFADREGNVVFHDRSYYETVEPKAIFGDGPDELHYTEIEIDEGDEAAIKNEIAVTREGGKTQTVTSEESESTYLVAATLPIANLMTADVCALALAGAKLERYKDPQRRITSLTIDPRPDARLWQAVLGLELDDVIVVRKRPEGGGPMIEQLSVVEGIQHDFSTRVPRTWKTVLSLTPLFVPTVEIPPDGVDPPENTSPPRMIGTAMVGLTLKVVGLGNWYDQQQEALTIGYQWQRSAWHTFTDEEDNEITVPTEGTLQDIAGATSFTYQLKAADEGKLVRCRVRASNSAGSGDGFTEWTAPVTLEPPPIVDEPPPFGDGSDGGGGGVDTPPTAHPFTLDVDALDDPLAYLG